MSFEKDKYLVVRGAVSKEVAGFINKYFLLKSKVAQTLFKTKYISPFAQEWGVWNDAQVPNTYSNYGDVAMETLLETFKPTMEEHTGLKLSESYAYGRIYKKGCVLERHKDRFSCEISSTLNLGGDLWSIYLEPSGKTGQVGIKVDLEPGDILIYSGCELEHWREEFKKDSCTQVFLHYNTLTEAGKNNKFDTREHLGLPSYFRKPKTPA